MKFICSMSADAPCLFWQENRVIIIVSIMDPTAEASRCLSWFAGICQQPSAIFLDAPVLLIKPDSRCFSTVGDKLGQTLRFANANTTTSNAVDLYGSCCQCSVFETRGCATSQVCMKTTTFSFASDGGRCSPLADLHKDPNSFAIGAFVPGLGFRCGCFPQSSLDAQGVVVQ